MIIAEVKVNDESQYEVRLFNCGWPMFRKMAARRFVAIGRTEEVNTAFIIDMLVRHLGWDR